MAGISAPLTQFPILHQLLDVIEFMAVENKSGEQVERFYFDLYRPEAEEIRKQIEAPESGTDFDDFAALGLH
jgi:hypothetical protein